MMRVYACLRVICGHEEEELVLAPSLSHSLNIVIPSLASYALELRRVREEQISPADAVWILCPIAERVGEAVHSMMAESRIISTSPRVKNDLAWIGGRILNRVSVSLRETTGEPWRPSPPLAGIITEYEKTEGAKP